MSVGQQQEEEEEERVVVPRVRKRKAISYELLDLE